MRYRPFGPSGAAVSALTLSLGGDALTRGPEAAQDLIYSALEAGINSFRLENADPVLAETVGEALGHVDRKLVCVTVTLGAGDGGRAPWRDFSAQGMTSAIDRILHVSGLGWLDVALLEEPGEDELAQSSLNALKALRATGRVRLLGVSGDGEVMDAYVSTGAFDALATPFHVNSPWTVRARMRAARERDMIIFGYGYYPESLAGRRRTEADSAAPKKRGLFGFGSSPRTAETPSSARASAFAFLHHTHGWTAEEICLAAALTDPSLSSVLVRALDAERLNALALVSERDMPPGLPAQIEMARVSAGAAA